MCRLCERAWPMNYEWRMRHLHGWVELCSFWNRRYRGHKKSDIGKRVWGEGLYESLTPEDQWNHYNWDKRVVIPRTRRCNRTRFNNGLDLKDR